MIDIKKDIKRHALKNPEEEVCGIVFLNEKLEPTIVTCRNTHPDPSSSFKISLDDLFFVKNKYQILALYHSHPKSPPNPSDCDINNSEENGYPMYIYSLPEDSFFLYRPASDFLRPLENRNFVRDINTCLTCALDYFIQKYGIPSQGFSENFVVPDAIDEANNKILDIIKRCSEFTNVKLQEVDIKSPIKQDDVLLMNPGIKGIPFHIGVISKQNTMLHHLINRLSTETAMRDLWTMSTIKRFSVI